MKFSLENSAGYSIRSYQAGQVEVVSVVHARDQADTEHITLSSSAIITPDRLVENWPPVSCDDLALEHINMVLATAPEVIILGTGSKLVFPDQQILHACYMGNVGIEVMDNGAACRTYNVLAAEGRQVAAALII